MIPTLVLPVVLLTLLSLQPPATADARIGSVQVKGNKRYTAEEVTRLSGLELGRAATPADLNLAANKMASTGLFESVQYTYTTGRAMTVTFEITEAAWTVPVVFDNFIWFPDEQLNAAVRAEVPSFDGSAPATAGAAEFLMGALQNVLKGRGIAGRVEFSPQVDMGTNRMKYLFGVKDPSPKVCALRITGTAAIPERDLVSPLQGIVGGDYSRFLLSTTAGGTLTDIYRRKGFWRAEFGAPQTVADSGCPGVSVTLPGGEGPVYAWDRAEWSGNQAFAADALDKALAMKSGEVADAGKIDNGLRAVRKLYGTRGYVAERADLEPRLDDSSRRAVFAIKIEEGPQYRMGALTFEGIRESDAAMLAKKWTLKRGDVYDEEYEKKYMSDEIYSRQTASGARGSLSTRVDSTAQVIDVKIVFK